MYAEIQCLFWPAKSRSLIAVGTSRRRAIMVLPYHALAAPSSRLSVPRSGAASRLRVRLALAVFFGAASRNMQALGIPIDVLERLLHGSRPPLLGIIAALPQKPAMAHKRHVSKSPVHSQVQITKAQPIIPPSRFLTTPH
jgi:hypothetical protein